MFGKLKGLFGKGSERIKPSKREIGEMLDQKLTPIFRDDDSIPIEDCIPRATREAKRYNAEREFGLSPEELKRQVTLTAMYHTTHRYGPETKVDILKLQEAVDDAFSKSD